ncbi:hypothetical protein AADZ90_008845 [Aestuariibius sp. 2305UL40-4]
MKWLPLRVQAFILDGGLTIISVCATIVALMVFFVMARNYGPVVER